MKIDQHQRLDRYKDSLKVGNQVNLLYWVQSLLSVRCNEQVRILQAAAL